MALVASCMLNLLVDASQKKTQPRSLEPMHVPICVKCGTSMWVVRIEDRPGQTAEPTNALNASTGRPSPSGASSSPRGGPARQNAPATVYLLDENYGRRPTTAGERL